ncbi:hypothetical protein A9Q02_11085 [Candidatus Chloroploca asiatica]|uniref:Uncharacterized protein n=1 Tax=Candidatus Chloroploca asiatica TaxID=1506545 RepID=A0A2H3KX35_9CHLR|nr:hypothetical protein A9Q02_11085 [Candidatus Chloroploca asiatica]
MAIVVNIHLLLTDVRLSGASKNSGYLLMNYGEMVRFSLVTIFICILMLIFNLSIKPPGSSLIQNEAFICWVLGMTHIFIVKARKSRFIKDGIPKNLGTFYQTRC